MFSGLGLDRRDITTVLWYLGIQTWRQVTRTGGEDPSKPSQREWFSTHFGHGPKLYYPPPSPRPFPSCSCVSSPSQFFGGCLSYRPLLIRSWHSTLHLSVICWACENAGSCLPHTLQGLRSRQKQFVDFFQSNQNKNPGFLYLCGILQLWIIA